MDGVMIKLANLAAGGNEIEKISSAKSTRHQREKHKSDAIAEYGTALRYGIPINRVDDVADSYKGDSLIDRVMRAEADYYRQKHIYDVTRTWWDASKMADKAVFPLISRLPGGRRRQAWALNRIITEGGGEPIMNPLKIYPEYRKTKSVEDINRIGKKSVSDYRDKLYRVRGEFGRLSASEQDKIDREHFSGLSKLHGEKSVDIALRRAKNKIDSLSDDEIKKQPHLTATHLANMYASESS